MAIDDDDPIPNVRETAEAVATRVVSFERRHGYGGLHHYFNALFLVARGDWLLLWNDDAVMLSLDWDERIRELPPEVLVADTFCPPHSPDMITFPAVRREACAVVGGFSPHNSHCDTYWEIIGRTLRVVRSVDVRVRHDRADLTGRHVDDTYRGQFTSGSHQVDFFSASVQDAIQRDIERLRGSGLVTA